MSFILTVFLLFPISITDSYHIACIQTPNINLPITQTCTYTQPDITSVSFLNLDQFDIPTSRSLQPSHPLAVTNDNYTQYNLPKPIHISPAQLYNMMVTIHVIVDNAQNTFCGPKNIILPVMNTDIRLKCMMQKWNAITNIIQYKCNPSAILPSTPSTTTRYAIDNEYKSALNAYDQQRRKLFHSNNTNTNSAKHVQHANSNMNSPDNLHINPLLFLIAFVPFTLCIFVIYAITKKRKKNQSPPLKNKNCKKNNSNYMSNGSQNTTSKVNKYVAIPVTESQIGEETQFQRERFIEMANSAHAINVSSCSNSNSDIETETQSTKTCTDYHQKRNSLVSKDEPQQIRYSENGKNTKNRIPFLRKRHSFDTVPSESIYSLTADEGRSYKESGYDNDSEQIDDDDLTFSPILSTQLSMKYMKVLPDDEEQSVSDNCMSVIPSDNNGHRNSTFYCGAALRKDSGDIDYDKLEINSWGTSLTLHGGMIEGKEELSKHKFFYNALPIKKKKKKSKFKQRIKDDATLNKELENDIINQMITDSEMSAAECY